MKISNLFFTGIPNHFWGLIPFSIISNLFSKVFPYDSFMFLKCLAQIDHERNLANRLKEQVESLHDLSQKARKNAWRRMDRVETLPYVVEDCLPK